MKTKDKIEIVVALRETARGLEQQVFSDEIAWQVMQALGIELMVLALKNGPLLEQIKGEDVPEEQKAAREAGFEQLIRRELAAVGDSVATAHEGRIREIDIIHERLVRQFDPSMAFNEAMNRAIEAKKAKMEAIVHMTPAQQFAFRQFQVPTLINALFNAGHESPVKKVHKVDNKVVTEMDKALKAQKSITGRPPQ